VEELRKTNQPIPEPSELSEIDSGKGVTTLIGVVVSNRRKNINVTVNEGLLEKIDQFAEDHEMTRSRFFEKAVKKYLEEEC
jgi:hypothetical protein